MRVVAVLANKEHPELGVISIPIPIRAGEYSSVKLLVHGETVAFRGRSIHPAVKAALRHLI